MTPNEFIEANGLTMESHFVPHSTSTQKDDEPCINWFVTIFNRECSARISTPYMQGIGHLPGFEYGNRTVKYHDDVRQACETRKWKGRAIPAPELADVLHCLVMDADAIDCADFAEWADNYGYDSDSIKALDTYTACVNTALKLRQMIDLDEAREVFQDY